MGAAALKIKLGGSEDSTIDERDFYPKNWKEKIMTIMVSLLISAIIMISEIPTISLSESVNSEGRYLSAQVVRLPSLSFPKPDGVWGCKFYNNCSTAI